MIKITIMKDAVDIKTYELLNNKGEPTGQRTIIYQETLKRQLIRIMHKMIGYWR